MPFGVPTGRLNGLLDQQQSPPGDFMPDQRPNFASVPQLGIMGSAQPMGIDGAMARALKPSFFGEGGVGRSIAGYIGDALQRMGGGQATFAPMMLQRQMRDAEEKQYERRQALQQQFEANKPFHVQDPDGNVVQVDPRTGKGTVLYHGSPRLSGLAAEIDQMERSGKFTPAEIAAYKTNHIDPIKMAATTDATTGTTTLTPYRTSTFGQPAPSGPPAVLDALPPNFKPVGGPASAPGTFPGITRAQIGVESGGRRGIAGPHTSYGVAHGLMQVQDGTAQEMARKLGAPWRPDLMRGTSDEAAQYQTAIGQAYYQEGLRKYGDPRKALMYYHGGPNEALWGPKTRAYADSVLARTGG